jgi:hypothetical protein
VERGGTGVTPPVDGGEDAAAATARGRALGPAAKPSFRAGCRLWSLDPAPATVARPTRGATAAAAAAMDEGGGFGRGLWGSRNEETTREFADEL